MKIAVIYGGTRPKGNTEILADLAVQGLDVEKIQLKDYKIVPIEDHRHSVNGFPEVNDDFNIILDRIFPCDIVIFATPIYWYSMSGIMKNFIDRWSQGLRDAKFPDFKTKMSAKKAYVIAVGGDAPHLKGLPMIQQFQYIFNFMGTSFEGYILGAGNQPGDVLNDKVALLAAEEMQKKLLMQD